MDPVIVPVNVLIAANEAYMKAQSENEAAYPVGSPGSHLVALGAAIHAALSKQAELGSIQVLK